MADQISLSVTLPFDQSKAAHDFLAALTFPHPKADGTLESPAFIQVTSPGRGPVQYAITHFAFQPGGLDEKSMLPHKVVIEAVALKLKLKGI